MTADAWPDVIELKGYTPKPGDVLFVRLDHNQHISEHATADMKKRFDEALPGVTVVLLSGISIESAVPEEPQPEAPQ